MVLQGATTAFEASCNDFDDSRAACLASSKLCGPNIRPNIQNITPLSSAAASSPRSSGVDGMHLPPAPGMRGVLGELAKAAANGSAAEVMAKHLMSNPNQVQHLTQAL